MKIDRVILIKRERDAGATFAFIAKVWKISNTRVRQIYFNNKNRERYRLLNSGSKNAELTQPQLQ